MLIRAENGGKLALVVVQGIMYLFFSIPNYLRESLGHCCWQLMLLLELSLLFLPAFRWHVGSNRPPPRLADTMLAVKDGDDTHSMKSIPDNLIVFLVPSSTILRH